VFDKSQTDSPFLAQPVDQLSCLGSLRSAHALCRFVQKQKLRVECERYAYFQSFLIAMGEEPAWGSCMVGQPYTFQDILNLIGKQQWDVGYSPDEKSIVYVAYMGGEASKGDANLCIVLVDANNLSSQKAVYCNTGAGYDFSDWSPDGHYIAITNWYSPDKNNPSSNIIMLDMQTFKATEPVLVGQLTRSPTWSPDSKSLAFFVITKENAPAFYVIGADGTGLSKLYSGPEWQKVWDDAQVKGGMYPYWIQAWVN